MSFLSQMLSDDAKISSKRFIGFASFTMLVGSWVANTFFKFAISETIRIMEEIDEVIDQHGGWPGAFQTETNSESI